MGSIRFAGQQIQSWNPASDPRSAEDGRVRILNGKNYYFDANGPKSGFGHRLVTGGKLGAGGDIQSVDSDSQSLIMASSGIYRQEYAVPALRDVLEPSTYWRQLTAFTESNAELFNGYRWYSAFLNGITYVCHKFYGLYRINLTDAVLHAIDGVPADPIGIVISGGRLIVVNSFIVAWSGPGDGFDFSPELGGAGLQLTNQYMSGEPIAVTSTDKEVIIWGTDSAMLMEYIGGEKVFRFSPINMGLYPISPMCITQYMQNTSFIMTKHGIAVVDGTQLNINTTPEYNQFIREFLNDNYLLKIRLDYIKEEDSLYVSLADSQPFYYQAYRLGVTLDKWGTFDEPHLGICRFGAERGSTGFADTEGYLHKFTLTPDREVRGKGLVGLDSFIDVGYLNTPEMIQQADTTLEIQELKISSRQTFPVDYADLRKVDLQGDGLYWNIEYRDFVNRDYNLGNLNFVWSEDFNVDTEDSMVVDDTLNEEGESLIIDDDSNDEGETVFTLGRDFNLNLWPNKDWNLSFLQASAIDYNALTLDDSEDYLYPPMTTSWTPAPGEYQDFMVAGYDLDRNGPFSFFNTIGSQLRIYSSFVGDEHELYFDPALAIQRENRDLYTTLTAGRFQFFRISATERWDYFHVTQFDATVAYQGQYS